MRLLGIPLLIVLLIKLDARQIYQILREANFVNVLVATLLIIPLIALKTIRWQVVLNAQGIQYNFVPAFLSYFASMFVGFFTPGRIGEFSKAIYVARERLVSAGRAFSGVLADRLFDLYTVFIISAIAMMNLYVSSLEWYFLLLSITIMVIPLFLVLNQYTYAGIQTFASLFGSFGKKVFASDGWFCDVRQGLLALNWMSLIIALLLTAAAYGLYFLQCQILALALGLDLTYLQITYVISLGGLVTLLPVSIAGLGTREAAITFYLSSLGVNPDRGLSFSLLVFIVFYIAASLIGALAWLIKPLPLRQTTTSTSDV